MRSLFRSRRIGGVLKLLKSSSWWEEFPEIGHTTRLGHPWGILKLMPGWRKMSPLDLGAVEVCPPSSPRPLGTMLGMATEGYSISLAFLAQAWLRQRGIKHQGGLANPCNMTSSVCMHPLPLPLDQFSNWSTWVAAESGEKQTDLPDRSPADLKSGKQLRVDHPVASILQAPGFVVYQYILLTRRMCATRNKFLGMHHSQKTSASWHKGLGWVPPNRLMKVTTVTLSNFRRKVILLTLYCQEGS